MTPTSSSGFPFSVTRNQTAFSYEAPNLIRVIMHCRVYKTVHPSSVSTTAYPALLLTWDSVLIPAVLSWHSWSKPLSQSHTERYSVVLFCFLRWSSNAEKDNPEITLIATEYIKTKIRPGIFSSFISLKFHRLISVKLKIHLVKLSVSTICVCQSGCF